MLHCPALLPESDSSRFDGGISKSVTSRALSNCVRRMIARVMISGGSFLDFPVAKSFYVSLFANDAIMDQL